MSLGFALSEIESVVKQRAAFLRDSPRHMHSEAQQLECYWSEIKKIVHVYLGVK